jgi:hypothetical protein
MKVLYCLSLIQRVQSLIVSQVLLPALQGHIPSQMIASIDAFLNFCYLIRRESHTEQVLQDITNALADFHKLREAFVEAGIYADGISLPRQHSLTHYPHLIRSFASPNGLCSSITESKHIKAVKEPWRRSNRYKALGQMLVTNQRLEKLASVRAAVDCQHISSNSAVTAEDQPAEAFSIDGSSSGHELSAGEPIDLDFSRPSADNTSEYDQHCSYQDSELKLMLKQTKSATKISGSRSQVRLRVHGLMRMSSLPANAVSD